MKKVKYSALLIVTLLFAKSVPGQIAPLKYDFKAIEINIGDHLPIKFSWTIAGKSQAFMNEGLNELREGRINVAIENFNEVIRQEPDFWAAIYYRGVCEKNIQSFGPAQNDFLEAIRLKNNAVEAYLELGELYQFQGNYDGAQDSFEKAIQYGQSNGIPYYYLGNLFRQKNNETEAIKNYKKCNDLSPKFPEAYIAQGLIALNQSVKEFKVIIRYMSKALDADSASRPALYLRGFIYNESNQQKKALADWSKLADITPTNETLRLLRAVLLAEEKRYDEAFRDYRRGVMATTPSLVTVENRADYSALAEYLSKHGYGLRDEVFELLKQSFCHMMVRRFKQGFELANRANTLQPSASCLLMKAYALERGGSSDSSLSNYNKVVNLDADASFAYLKKGQFASRGYDVLAGEKDFGEVIRIEPGSPVGYGYRAEIRMKAKQYLMALPDLKMVAKLKNDHDPYIWHIIAGCYVELSRYDSAAITLEKAIELFPDQKQLYTSLSKIKAMENDSTGRLKILKKMEKQWPNDFGVILFIAGNRVDLKQYDSALYFANKGAELAPGEKKYPNISPEKMATVMLIAQIHIEKGDVQNGIAMLDELLRYHPELEYPRFLRATQWIKQGRMEEVKKDIPLFKDYKYRTALMDQVNAGSKD